MITGAVCWDSLQQLSPQLGQMRQMVVSSWCHQSHPLLGLPTWPGLELSPMVFAGSSSQWGHSDDLPHPASSDKAGITGVFPLKPYTLR